MKAIIDKEVKMNAKGIVLYTLVVALTLMLISTAKAEDFNFTVPVEMNNLLPRANSIKVSCSVRKENGQQVGVGQILVPVPDSGNLSMNVAVNFNAGDGLGRGDYDPSTATSYRCEFSVLGGGNIAPGYCDYTDPRITGYFACAKPKTPFTFEVMGTIPK